MRISLPSRRVQALTLVEVLVVLFALAVLGALLLPALAKAKSRQSRFKCVNNLKNVGLAFRIFATDNEDLFPMHLSTNKGGAQEFRDAPFSAFRHFQALSNELSTPMIVVCPEDRRIAATNFIILANRHVSYFVGLAAEATKPNMILSGDRSITNGIAPKNGFLELRTAFPARWLERPHHNSGNIAFADGRVQQLMVRDLRQALRQTGDPTNRIALP